ncbi:methyltransferase domain-containing protein [Lacinutrix sp. C3R15]|uniref:spermine/spermidine synthase domain-containing protein n=1 Tax=Flavobacteriaceae TaxID=49546 RepID=UPI001C081BF7|nr:MULTISPECIES: methyltransferase domain-containing protein [Flavobacteriaceae]MBU2940787.1 methyltransferase domain-containing protein [Lacinutrix sp. C3R15]MDO6624105.1 methyltransferase domain-containing protein [Oceanihabitans sp. 1_MG-2023]
MKKLLSYIWPLTSNTIDSDTNGKLEIIFYNGKKMLNSKDANYSYGSLQKILEYALSRIELKEIKHVLLLGLGGGSVIYSLREKFGFNGHIQAVEIDDKMISIAKNDFNISASQNLTISKYDAYKFVQENNKKQDLIIIDLFINNQVPSQFYSSFFCENVSKLMNKNGYFIFNLGIKGKMSKKTNEVIRFFKNSPDFETSFLKNIEKTNNVIIGKKIR